MSIEDKRISTPEQQLEYEHINPEEYKKIFTSIDWYLNPILQEFISYYGGYINKDDKSQEWIGKQKEITKLYLELFEQNKIALGEQGENFDIQRKPIDTFVIHHSGSSSKSLIEIDALHLVRLYVPVYKRKSEPWYGKPIWSGHFNKNGRQTFISYHWIVSNGGKSEQILNDEYIGWHAGNWDINCSSVGICLNGNFAKEQPTDDMIQSVEKVIQDYTFQYPNIKIFGHKETKISGSTECPGLWFDKWRKNFKL